MREPRFGSKGEDEGTLGPKRLQMFEWIVNYVGNDKST